MREKLNSVIILLFTYKMLTKWKGYKENVRLPLGIHDTYDSVTILLKSVVNVHCNSHYKVVETAHPIFMLQTILLLNLFII